MGCSSLHWKVSTAYHHWGVGEHSTTAACFKQLQEGWEMAQWILCPQSQGQIMRSPRITPLQRKYGSVTSNSGRAGTNQLYIKKYFFRKKIYVKH